MGVRSNPDVEKAILASAIGEPKQTKYVEDVPEPPTQPVLFQSDAEKRLWVYKLPWPPSVNSYWSPFVFKPKSGKGIPVAGMKGMCVMVRMILSSKGTAYKELATRVIAETGRPNTKQRLSVVIHLCPPDRRAIDIDNRVKAVFDVMQSAGVFENDEQIDMLTVQRFSVVGKEKACANVFVREIS